jgi:hypothetical protein
MEVSTTIGGYVYTFSTSNFYDLSISVHGDYIEDESKQLSCFGINSANFVPYSTGNWVADTRKGASVNW